MLGARATRKALTQSSTTAMAPTALISLPAIAALMLDPLLFVAAISAKPPL
jgi:hypothetical protein